MTVIYIHGVKVRSSDHGRALAAPIGRWMLPHLGPNANYEPVYWGDLAADFRWNRASRPPTPLLEMGGPQPFAGLGSLRSVGEAKVLDAAVAVPRPAGGPLLGAAAGLATGAPAQPLSAVVPERRADFLADLYLAARERDSALPTGAELLAAEPGMAALAAAADAVAQRWDVLAATAPDDARRAELLLAQVHRELHKADALLTQGAIGDWLSSAGELLRRAVVLPADAVGTVIGEARPLLHGFLSDFLGDVLTYLHHRLNADGSLGPIPERVLAALRAAHERKQRTGEKIVVLTHSMGGQLLYDALTTFIHQRPEFAGLEIDHWITFGSQVSFFAELGLFLGQPATRAPGKLSRPACVKAWDNFYDTNDPVGFVMAPVFSDVTDHPYDTGYGLLLAHTGFLGRPSFFAAIAKLIK